MGGGTRIRFARSARKHLVGRARALHVITSPLVILTVPATAADQDDRIVYLGDDQTGRALEVVAVATDNGLLVIHVQDLQKKFRSYYEEAKERQ